MYRMHASERKQRGHIRLAVQCSFFSTDAQQGKLEFCSCRRMTSPCIGCSSWLSTQHWWIQQQAEWNRTFSIVWMPMPRANHGRWQCILQTYFNVLFFYWFLFVCIKMRNKTSSCQFTDCQPATDKVWPLRFLRSDLNLNRKREILVL